MIPSIQNHRLGSTSTNCDHIVFHIIAPAFPPAPINPATIPTHLRWTYGTRANVDPSDICTKRLKTTIVPMADGISRIWLKIINITPSPPRQIKWASRRPGIPKYFRSVSENMPPRARAKRFINPNNEAIKLALFWVSMLHLFGPAVVVGPSVVVLVRFVATMAAAPSVQLSFLNAYRKYKFMTVLTEISTPKHIPYCITSATTVTISQTSIFWRIPFLPEKKHSLKKHFY